MPRSTYKSNSWIPEIGNRADAQQAMKVGAFAAWFVAAVNIAIGAYILFSAPEAMRTFGVTGMSIIDGVCFALVGIFTWRYSLSSAWIGLILFSLEKIFQWVTQPKAIVGIVMAVILWIGFLNGVRGAVALRRFNREAANAPLGTEAAEG
ncbi:hypothetical protein [Luteibacter sp.]|uniref:hypothetical protein n=1 Tax=Luteibacter sp. TaxID=1886636 RepID=UPI003F7E3677